MKNLKTILIAASLLVSVTAFAQAEGINGAAGKGIANNQKEQSARFDFRVGESRQSNPKGSFSITVGGEDLPSRVHIDLKRIANLESGEKRAQFGGLAVLIVNRNGQPQRIEGRLQVTVFDITGPNESGESRPQRDRIKVEFRANNSDLTFDYEGFVNRGDIKVH